MQKILFIDRDGTLVKEPLDYQVDDFQKLVFYPQVFVYLHKIATELDFELVMVTNQDGLGTAAYPLDKFELIQQFIMNTLDGEGIHFSEVHIDRTFPEQNAPTRKPGTGMLLKYFDEEKYDLKNSFVIGDRITDVELAKNLGSKAIWMNQNSALGSQELRSDETELITRFVALETADWQKIYEFLKLGQRKVEHVRNTNETQISISLHLDSVGKSAINTGIHFFDHMLEQIARHGNIDICISAQGDLHIDEHHTIEDVGIALGEAFYQLLGDKRGIERYGFCLPMDDCLAQVAIDFGGRSWLVWDAQFKREKVGEMPTEMFFHFFKSFSDAAKCNLNIKAEGDNEHHKIEAIFKCFAKAIKMAVRRDVNRMLLPSTKGVL